VSVITLDGRTQQSSGIETTSLMSAPYQEQVRAYAVVLDVARLIELSNNYENAKAQLYPQLAWSTSVRRLLRQAFYRRCCQALRIAFPCRREVNDALRDDERRPVLTISKSELVKHRMIGNVELSYVIRLEYAALFPKHQTDGATASARGGVVERLRQLMLPVFSGQELSSETVIDGSLGWLARLPGEVLRHNAALLLQAGALIVSQPPAPVAMPWPAM
jgi:hypothetical protein